MPLKLSVVVLQCRVELVCPMETTAVGDHDHFFPGRTKDGHDLKLQARPQQNMLTRVLQEYGKLEKTIFILRYI